MKKASFLIVFIVPFLMGCPHKKDVVETKPLTDAERMAASINNYQVAAPPATTNEIDLVADSAYLYAKETYLWNTNTKTTWDSSLLEIGYNKFNPRQYNSADVVATGQKVMAALKAFSSNNDRFSFATTKEESDGIQTGETKDYGFFVKPAYINATDVKWFLTYVYAQSDAGLKGVKRGWIINKINGTPIVYDNASIALLNDLLFGSGTAATIEFLKHDGTPVSLTLNKTDFQANSVLYSNVITTNGKNVGYLVFNSFFGAPSRTELQQVFDNFQSKGINELIVDLRNNSGGSTETQDMLANIIAPAAANGKTMYSYEFNPLLQQDKFPLLKKKFRWANGSFTLANNTEKFQKIGTLNLSRVFFIGTNSTASASELLINNLKPVMNVQLIGDTTYGKPVGFFPIVLFNKVALYPISFRTINGAGNADYYHGFVPDRLANDGVNKDWGDVTDPCLAAALYYINNNKYAVVNNTLPRSVMGSASTQKALQNLNDQKFSGMFIETK